MRVKTENGTDVDLEQFFEDIKVVVRDCQDLLKAGMSTVTARARTGAETTNRAIRERPYQTIGIAFGVGLVVGLLAWSSFSRRGAEIEED